MDLDSQNIDVPGLVLEYPLSVTSGARLSLCHMAATFSSSPVTSHRRPCSFTKES